MVNWAKRYFTRKEQQTLNKEVKETVKAKWTFDVTGRTDYKMQIDLPLDSQSEVLKLVLDAVLSRMSLKFTDLPDEFDAAVHPATKHLFEKGTKTAVKLAREELLRDGITLKTCWFSTGNLKKKGNAWNMWVVYEGIYHRRNADGGVSQWIK